MRRILTALLALALPTCAHALSSSTIPTKVPTYWAQTASASFSTCPVPIPSQISITPGRASWTDGFPPLTFLQSAAGGVPPFGQDINGALCQISQWTRWFNAGGSIPYDATFQNSIGGYPKGAIVPSAATFGLYWVSTAENNISNPDSGGAGWTLFGSNGVSSLSGSSTTYVNSQCVSTVSRSNAASPMLDTLPGTSPGVLPANCKITITNNDASALLGIQAGSGAVIKNIGNFASLGIVFLGPGQVATFQSDGSNYFPINIPDRTVLGANTTFYVAPTGGSNSNSGLTSSAPFGTLQFAWTYLQSVLDLHGYNLTIQASAAGTFPHGFVASGLFVGQAATSSVLIEGNDSSTSTYVINETTATTDTVDGVSGAQFKISGFKFTGNANLLRAAHNGTHIIAGVIEVGSNGGSNSQLAASAHAQLEFQGNITFDTVNASGAMLAAGQAQLYFPPSGAITITFVGTPVWSNGFAACESNGSFFNRSTIAFAGSFTGPRYSGNLNCVIDTNSSGNVNFFPGSAPGSLASGAQYN